MRFTDPTGMVIEDGSKKEWERQKGYVERRRDNLQGKVDRLSAKAEAKGWSSEKIASRTGNLTERVSSLSSSLTTMGKLEESSQVYSLNPGASKNEVTYDSSTGNVVISYNGTALFTHETTHAGQFETGDIAFDSSTGATLAQDIYDEVAGYKAQWAYDPSSVGNFKSSSQITPGWVQGITEPGGNQPYRPGGTANTGESLVNINTNRDGLIRAYPHLKSTLRTYPAGATLKTIVPTIHYNK